MSGFISIEGISRRYGASARHLRRPLAVDAARRIRLRHRPFRLRQDHRAEHPRRPRHAHRRRRHRRRQGDRRPLTRPRRHLPGPLAAAVAHGDGQRRLRRLLAPPRLETRAGQRTRANFHRPRRPHRLGAQAPGRTLRRHEAARRHCACAVDRAEDHADGRAVLGARRADPRHAAGRGAPHLHRHRADRVHDHA